MNKKAVEAHEKAQADAAGATVPPLSLPVSQAELDGIQRAWDAMTDLAQYINEMKRDLEVKQFIEAVQQRFFSLSSFLDVYNVHSLKYRYVK